MTSLKIYYTKFEVDTFRVIGKRRIRFNALLPIISGIPIGSCRTFAKTKDAKKLQRKASFIVEF